jgi:small GTP-binding protein
MNEIPDLKLVLVGDKNVGKTSIFHRFVYNQVLATPDPTIGAYFALKTCKIMEKFYKVAIWDTAGEEKFDALTKFYTRGANCALLCFDLTDLKTFLAIKKWAKLIENDCVLMILGNKYDLIESGAKQREIKVEEIEAYAAQINALHCEGSALTGSGIRKAYDNVLTNYMEQVGGILPSRRNLIDLDTVDFRKSKRKCC